MKRFYFLLVLSVLFPLNAGWEQQTSGTTNDLQDIFFINPDTGWAVGQEILLTRDGGETWLLKADSAFMNAVQFHNRYWGWAVGDDGVILRSANGGNQWWPQSSPTTQDLYDVYFQDIDTGWAVGYQILSTVDRGQTWTVDLDVAGGVWLETLERFGNKLIAAGTAPGYYIKDIQDTAWTFIENGQFVWTYDFSFINDSTGWAISSSGCGDASYCSYIYRTSDAGSTWTRLSSIDASIGRSICFLDENTGFLTRSIRHTTNGGYDWEIAVGGPSGNQIFFLDDSTGWIAGMFGGIYKTSDRGGLSGIKSCNKVDGNAMDITMFQNRIEIDNIPGKATLIQLQHLDGSAADVLIQRTGTRCDIFTKGLSRGVYILVCKVNDESTSINKYVKMKL